MDVAGLVPGPTWAFTGVGEVSALSSRGEAKEEPPVTVCCRYGLFLGSHGGQGAFPRAELKRDVTSSLCLGPEVGTYSTSLDPA